MKPTKIAGWVLSGLIAAVFLVASAPPKLTEWEGKAEHFGHLGYTVETMAKIAVVEIACTVLFLVPPTSFLGAVLLTAYLGGAVASHARIGEPFVPPLVIGVMVWVALGLREPKVFRLAFWRGAKSPETGEETNG